ncbi:MAG: helix-turn-helix domain-containing protein [Planctomycetota bacterium]
MTDPAPLVLRLGEVCAMLDISDDTAYRRIKAKGEPFQHAYLEGREHRVPVADVVSYLDARSIPVPRTLRQVVPA